MCQFFNLIVKNIKNHSIMHRIFFCFSSLVLCAIPWFLPLPNEFFFQLYPKPLRMFFFFSFTKHTNLVQHKTLKMIKFDIVHDLHNKKFPNMIENNIQIKITLPTNIWSMITMQFFERWQNLTPQKFTLKTPNFGGKN